MSQGGKGRTGLFSAALLLWTGFREGAGNCLDAFAGRRTDRTLGKRLVQGVSAPCQIRYLHYLEALMVDPRVDYRSPRQFLLREIQVHSVPFYNRQSTTLSFVVECDGVRVYDSAKQQGLKRIGLKVVSLLKMFALFAFQNCRVV